MLEKDIQQFTETAREIVIYISDGLSFDSNWMTCHCITKERKHSLFDNCAMICAHHMSIGSNICRGHPLFK